MDSHTTFLSRRPYMSKVVPYLGTMFYGSLLSNESSLQQLNHAYKSGIRHFDTASMYPVPASLSTFGLTESIIGKWLTQFSKRERHDITISSKFPNYSQRLPFLRESDTGLISYRELKSSVTSSLKRLGIDSLSSYLLHWPSRSTINFGAHYLSRHDPNIEDSLNQLSQTILNLYRLYEEGLVENIGISNETPLGLFTALSTLRSNKKEASLTIQNPYSLISTGYENSLQEICHAYKVRVMAHSPLSFGLLGSYPHIHSNNSRHTTCPQYFQRYQHQHINENLIPALASIAKANSMNLSELSYRYLLSNPTLDAIVIGASSNIHIDDSLKSISHGTLEPSILSDIRSIQRQYTAVAW